MDSGALKLEEKTRAIFREIAGDRAGQIGHLNQRTEYKSRLMSALADRFDAQALPDIIFHVLDWDHNAAFLLAFALFPERFSDTELQEGVCSLLIHVPNHLAAAAKLSGYPVQDIFGVGDLTQE